MKYARNVNICKVSVFQSHLIKNWTSCTYTCVCSLTNHQFWQSKSWNSLYINSRLVICRTAIWDSVLVLSCCAAHLIFSTMPCFCLYCLEIFVVSENKIPFKVLQLAGLLANACLSGHRVFTATNKAIICTSCHPWSFDWFDMTKWSKPLSRKEASHHTGPVIVPREARDENTEVPCL